MDAMPSSDARKFTFGEVRRRQAIQGSLGSKSVQGMGGFADVPT